MKETELRWKGRLQEAFTGEIHRALGLNAGKKEGKPPETMPNSLKTTRALKQSLCPLHLWLCSHTEPGPRGELGQLQSNSGVL